MGSGFTSGCPSEPVCWQVRTAIASAGVTPPLLLHWWYLRPQAQPHVQVCLPCLLHICVLTSHSLGWPPPPAHDGNDLFQGRMGTPQHRHLASAAVQGTRMPWELHETPWQNCSLLAQLWLPGEAGGVPSSLHGAHWLPEGLLAVTGCCWEPLSQILHTKQGAPVFTL